MVSVKRGVVGKVDKKEKTLRGTQLRCQKIPVEGKKKKKNFNFALESENEIKKKWGEV